MGIPSVVASEQVECVVCGVAVCHRLVCREGLFPVYAHRVGPHPRAYAVRLAVEGEARLVASEPPFGVVCPPYVSRVWGVVAAVDECERARHFAECHRMVVVFHGKVAVEEHGPCCSRGVEWLLPVEVDGAFQVDAVAGERVVGAFKVATVVEYASSPAQGAQVEAANEPHVARHSPVAVAIGYLCLRYGVAAPRALQRRLQRVVEVGVAEVSHG